jgi:hypothetical protein
VVFVEAGRPSSGNEAGIRRIGLKVKETWLGKMPDLMPNLRSRTLVADH